MSFGARACQGVTVRWKTDLAPAGRFRTSTAARDAAMLNASVTREAERAYVRRWVETGRLLDDLRRRELRALSPSAALEASDRLIDAALRVALPPHRQHWSGLVEWQARVHRRP